TTVLPEKMLRLLSPADRKSIGQMTADEAFRKAEVKNEGDLQRQIISLLRLKGIEPLWHRMDKRSAATIGWPDITFCVEGGYDEVDGHITTPIYGCVWEIKFRAQDQPSIEQQQMHLRLSTLPNCWRVRVIRSVDEALEELN